MNKEKWINYGDIDFYTYGGCLVRHSYSEAERKAYPSLKDLYSVIMYNPELYDEEEGKVILGVQEIDVSDINDELKLALLSAIGEEHRADEPMFSIMSPLMWAKELAEYRGYNGASAPFNPYGFRREDYIVSKAAAVLFMRSQGVDAEVSGFYDRILEEYEDIDTDEISFSEFLKEKLKRNKENPPEETSSELNISDITDEEIQYLLKTMGEDVAIADIKGVVEDTAEDTVHIRGILFEHGPNDFSLWDKFSLSEEEENMIQQILMKHTTEGCSVRGTKEEVVNEMK